MSTLNGTHYLKDFARVFTVIIFLFLAVYFLSQGINDMHLNPFQSSFRESIMNICLYLALGGLVAGFVSEGLGGMISVSALLSFSIASYIFTGHVIWGVWLLGIPAALYVMYWAITINHDDAEDKDVRAEAKYHHSHTRRRDHITTGGASVTRVMRNSDKQGH